MRETKKFKTTGGYEVELKTYVTFGEAREISDVFLEGIKVEMNDGVQKMSGVNAGLSSKAEDKAIENIVVSINGNKEEVLKQVKELPKKDGDEVILEINKVTNPITEEKKTK